MKTRFFSYVAWSFVAFVASVSLFTMGYSHGHSDGVMSASAGNATELRKLHSQLATMPTERLRDELLRMADHSLMLNAETYRLGPWLSGLLVDRHTNYEIMRRYAEYRTKSLESAPIQDQTLKRALQTFSN